MAARQIIVPGAMPSRDANGRSMPAKFRFYAPDTALSVPAVVYADEALGTPHAFPIVSDAAGRFPQIWAEEAERFDVAWTRRDDDAPIATYSDIRPLSDAVAASVGEAAQRRDEAEAAAQRAEAAAVRAEAAVTDATGAPLTATSATSLAVGVGLKSFTLDQLGKLFTPGQGVVIARTAAPMVRMTGVVVAHDSATGAMSVEVTSAAGAGTHADWSVALSAPGGVESIAGLTGAVTAADARAALDVPTVEEARSLVGPLVLAFAVSL